jgi:multiple sugar transport system permease protein
MIDALRTPGKYTDPVAPTAPRRPRPRIMRGRPGLTPWLFLLVPLAFLVTFTYVPVVNLVHYSLTDWDGFSADKTFIGLSNYISIFTKPQLFQVFYVSLYYLAGSVVQLTLALYFATILSFNTRLRNLFKGILFFPSLINGVAIGFVFLYFFQPGGVLDSILKLFGANGQHLWLGDPALANWSLASVSVWRYMGMSFVLFLGAIQSIPADIYEAAEIDGASRWDQFWHIILPGIRPIVGLSAILAISGSLSVFEIPFIMTTGASGTQTFVIQTVKQAFEFNRVGLASASAVVLLAIVLVVTWIQRRVFRDEKADLV